MSWLRRLAMVAAYFAGVISVTDAHAGAKDESGAEWLAPKWFNEWHDGLAAKGLNFGATYIGDFIGNVSGGTSRGFIHLGRFDFSRCRSRQTGRLDRGQVFRQYLRD